MVEGFALVEAWESAVEQYKVSMYSHSSFPHWITHWHEFNSPFILISL